MNDNIFKYNDRKRAEHDKRFNVFCEVYDPTKKSSKKEWLDILKKKGVVITRMTLHRYTKKYFENVTHEEGVSHEDSRKSHIFESVSLEEIVNSTKENPVIREILLQERTTKMRFWYQPRRGCPSIYEIGCFTKGKDKDQSRSLYPDRSSEEDE